MSAVQKFAPGDLVKVREREWVVLPHSREDLLMVRPLGGTDEEVTGILTELERVDSASFDHPNPEDSGDDFSCRMLRDAVRLGFRSSAGPFRSFGRIAVEPRPYQLVPLLIALRRDPIRILVADDVGIGKTVESCLIAKEMLDRGEVNRLAVLCPPHLAEQWQAELSEKFNIEAELVLSSTVKRLEKHCGLDQSLFDVFPFVVVSTDFVKSDRRRDDFIRSCPKMVIVDEAHTCAFGGAARGGKHQRYDMLKKLSEDPERHLVLVTATPHSGKEETFRSLIGLLDPSLEALPEDLSGDHNRKQREQLAKFIVQRRRVDIREYLGEETPFPERKEPKETPVYKLSEDYKKLFNRVLNYAQEMVEDKTGSQVRQRVRWWSALALLRALASSPAAAAATLRSRAQNDEATSLEQADEIGRATILDAVDDDNAEGIDITPGGQAGDEEGDSDRPKLLEMAREAEKLFGEGDEKLQKIVKPVKDLIKQGYAPILFCRFIDTAEYLADQLREKLRGVEVMAITGRLAPAERESRVHELGKAGKRVLVCTDCLSEGTNLQEHFSAVIHYDLAWNPTRHEQREGRVDRYGQVGVLEPDEGGEMKRTVRVMTYHGVDNQIDGIVLDVLINKHKKIRKSLGVSVPVPANTEQVVEAIFEGLLLREKAGGPIDMEQMVFEEILKPEKEALNKEWENVSEREQRTRSLFKHAQIDFKEVDRELKAARAAVGSNADVETFLSSALLSHGAFVSLNGSLKADLTECSRSLRDIVPLDSEKFEAAFRLPVKSGIQYLHRTHPIVEAIASFILNTALDPKFEGIAKRAGVIRNSQVPKRTTLLLLRLRFHIITTRRGGDEANLLAEDSLAIAFRGAPEAPEWLSTDDAESLLQLEPEQNTNKDLRIRSLQNILEGIGELESKLEEMVRQRGEELLEAHQRVRKASRETGLKHRVEPTLPPDILGLYVYLPNL